MARASIEIHQKINVTDSTWIADIGYDVKSNTMEVNTRDGNRYRYYDIGALTFAEVITAKSVGGAFNALIKGNYRRRKLSA